MLTLIYLAAIVLANLSVTYFGPSISVVNSFLFVGLDLAIRDALHDKWQRQVATKMPLLIAAGSLLSMLSNYHSWRIALASMIAFALSETVKTIFYVWLSWRTRVVRVGIANVFASLVDSTAFPTIAFGQLLPLVVLGQFVAKVAGAMLWALIFRSKQVEVDNVTGLINRP
jgi:uncharacterized PurR-regulated membrane protein YhhQ (DUF165 family)